MEKWSWFHPHKWDYRSTGELIVRYDPVGGGHAGLRKSWADGQARKLEGMVAAIVEGGIKLGDALRRHTIIRREEEAKRREEARRREEAERQRRLELERRERLEHQAEQWGRSLQLRDFIKAAEDAFYPQVKGTELEKKLDEWLAWARQHADRINPLKDDFPFGL